MDKPDVFMPLYIGDYLAGTSRLTTELHGAYLLLIMDYWMNGPLPDDDSLLSSIVKMTPDAWSIARAKLEYYFSVSDGLWNHKRIEEELASATEKKLKARDKAKKAANARWHGAQSIATSTPQALLKECPSPSPSPSPKKNKDIVELKPDVAGEMIEYLNLKSGRSYRNVKTHADHIKARIKEGYSVEEIKAVIDRKCLEWVNDTEMQQYLRPSTLFNNEKFNNYAGQIDAPLPEKKASHNGYSQPAKRKIKDFQFGE